MSRLRPWAQWLVDRKLKYVLVAISALLLPVHLVLVVGAALIEGTLDAFESWWRELVRTAAI
jgi:hypothetical protein